MTTATSLSLALAVSCLCMSFALGGEPNRIGGGLIGGAKDEHGCIGGAGFQYCQTTKSCYQPWVSSCPEDPAANHVLQLPSQFTADFSANVNLLDGNVMKARNGHVVLDIENNIATASYTTQMDSEAFDTIVTWTWNGETLQFQTEKDEEVSCTSIPAAGIEGTVSSIFTWLKENLEYKKTDHIQVSYGSWVGIPRLQQWTFSNEEVGAGWLGFSADDGTLTAVHFEDDIGASFSLTFTDVNDLGASNFIPPLNPACGGVSGLLVHGEPIVQLLSAMRVVPDELLSGEMSQVPVHHSASTPFTSRPFFMAAASLGAVMVLVAAVVYAKRRRVWQSERQVMLAQ